MSDFDTFEKLLEDINNRKEENEEIDEIKKLNEFIGDVLLIKSFSRFKSSYGYSYIINVKSKNDNKDYKIYSTSKLTKYLDKVKNYNFGKKRFIYNIKEEQYTKDNQTYTYINFSILCSISVKNVIGILIGIALNL